MMMLPQVYAKRPTKTCPQCEAVFMPKGGRQTCCSRKCARQRAWIGRERLERLRHPCGYLWRRVPVDYPGAVLRGGRQSAYILEHRLVMEQTIGRPLTRGEHVHHKNGNRSDNRPENLELWVGKKDPPGQRVEDLLIALAEQPELLVIDEAMRRGVLDAVRRTLKL